MLYYNAKIKTMPHSPNDYYREQMQQLINEQWDNTTMLQDIEEEYPFKSFAFRPIQVRMIHALDKSTRAKQGNMPFLYSNMQKLYVNCFEFLKPLQLQHNYEIWISVNVAKAEKM